MSKKNEVKVTERDYRTARYILVNIGRFMSVKSPAARAIMQSCEKVIALYKFQNKGIEPATPIQNPANLHGEWMQNANLFFGIAQRQRA